MSTDGEIARLWSEGLTRPEIAAQLNVSLAHVRYVVGEARKIEAADLARYKRIHVDGARSELGALARQHRLPDYVVRARARRGKKGDDLVAPVRDYGKPKARMKAGTLVHALPADAPSLDEATIGMIALAKFDRWPVTKICQAFGVHPRQVQMIRAKTPMPLRDTRWNIAGETLTIEEISLRAHVSTAATERRIRQGWRGLQLLQPLQRVRKDDGTTKV